MRLIARSTLIVAFFFGIDKVLGLVRQLIVTRQFALSHAMDAFNAANNIPDMLSALISGGALGVALIPVLTEYLSQRGRPQAWDLFSRILNLAFLVTAAISLLILFFSTWLVNIVVAPQFTPDQKLMTVRLMRLDLLAIVIFSISGLIMAGLQANKHFLLPAMAPVLYNIGQIFGCIILAPTTGMKIASFTFPAFGLGIYGLAYGVIIGAILHLVIQIPGLLKYKFQWNPGIDLRNPGVQQVLFLLGPRVITMFFIQLFFIVRDNLASGLGEGAITALTLGWFIMQVPETLLGTAIGIAILPTLSEQYVNNDLVIFKKTVNSAVRVLIALTIPIAALMAIGIYPIVQTAFKLKAGDTGMIVFATIGFLLGLTGHSLLEIATRGFYAQQNAKIPLYAAAINAIVFTFFAWLVSKVAGQTGIAVVSSIVFTIQAVILLSLLNRSYPGLFDVRNTFIRTCVCTICIAVPFYFIMKINGINPLVLSVGGMGLGMLIILPFIMPELRLLIKIDS